MVLANILSHKSSDFWIWEPEFRSCLCHFVTQFLLILLFPTSGTLHKLFLLPDIIFLHYTPGQLLYILQISAQTSLLSILQQTMHPSPPGPGTPLPYLFVNYWSSFKIHLKSHLHVLSSPSILCFSLIALTTILLNSYPLSCVVSNFPTRMSVPWVEKPHSVVCPA